MADVTVTTSRPTIEATVVAGSRPALSVDVTPGMRPELAFTVEVVRPQVSVQVNAGGGTLPSTQAFTHTQSTPSDEWSVSHPFGSVPASLMLLDGAGTYLIPDPAEISATRVVLLFAVPTTGTLRLLKG